MEELIGKGVSQFLTPQGLELAREVQRILLSGEEMKQPYEQRIIRRDGTEAILLLTTSLLGELVTQLQEQFGIDMNLRTEGSDRHFTPEKELLIYRIVQEALRNIWKHSEATRAEIVIKLGEDRITIIISDNGRGFNADESVGFLETGKLGLAGMKERAHLLGGTLTVCSKLNSGTKVILDIPNKNLAV